ncbi:hypothetical protein C8Q76DRAFT_693056 [Earliella scabrosa]|nr:hypothetical protein C8Q76DRAFT_693056 [Earliella scabrosa]
MSFPFIVAPEAFRLLNAEREQIDNFIIELDSCDRHQLLRILMVDAANIRAYIYPLTVPVSPWTTVWGMRPLLASLRDMRKRRESLASGEKGLYNAISSTLRNGYHLSLGMTSRPLAAMLYCQKETLAELSLPYEVDRETSALITMPMSTVGSASDNIAWRATTASLSVEMLARIPSLLMARHRIDGLIDDLLARRIRVPLICRLSITRDISNIKG